MSPQWTVPLDITTLSSSTREPPHSRHDPPQQPPEMPRLRLLQRSSKTNSPQPILRLNRLHPPLPSDLSQFAAPVRNEFLRVSTVAAKKYATPPDPADDHDHSCFEFPSVIIRDPSPLQQPRRRNIHHLIELYNNNNASSTSHSPHQSPAPSNPQAHPQFNIQSVRQIFERHIQKLDNDVSLSSVTDSVSPSDASHPRFQKHKDNNTTSDHRPRRIAFADLSNTLDLSPCPSSTSDTRADDRLIPPVTPPPYFTASNQQSVGRKKSFAVFRSVKKHHLERARAKSFANGEFRPMEQSSGRRFTNAERPRNNWLSRHVRAYGGSVRRRLESLRNRKSHDDDDDDDEY